MMEPPEEGMDAISEAQVVELWQGALGMAVRISDMARGFPPEQRFALGNQMRRSSSAAATSIGEALRIRREADGEGPSRE